MRSSTRSANSNGFLKAESAWLFIGLLLGTLLLPACATSQSSHSTFTDPAFKKAEAMYQRGSYERAISRFTDVIHSRAGRYDEALLAKSYQLRGACRKALSKYALARYDFEDAIKIAQAASPYGDRKNLIVESRIAIGDAYMHEGAYMQAAHLFADLIKEPVPTDVRDAALYRRYICALKLDQPDPDRFVNRIESMRNFDAGALRREFLEGGTPTPLYRTTPWQSAPPTADTLGKLTILPREQWNARSIRSNIDPMTPIFRITVHHTADRCDQSDLDSSAAMILYYQKVHQDKKGWADIGYHFIIDRAGRVWEGRPISYQGAHAGNSEKNRGNIGVCLLGDFTEQQVNTSQKSALAGLLRELCRIYKLNPGTQIYTHKEMQTTECPGPQLHRVVEDFRRIYL
ncbi:MAG: N-acetylmuramoyl-L-alanine amidase [Planctomycetota bacterium]|jgi:tetratricopeptide (TPR) repeat protein